jgi:uncharacterized protein with von Willebrand factor type A (vWA) domain
MRDYSQLHNVDLYQRLMPTFDLKLLTKDLIVNVPVDRTEHKQKIIIMLDYSGSMNEREKQEWVVAVLVDRLRYAMKEEAEIFFSYFTHDVARLKFTHIYNKQTALAFWTTFSTCPNGGDTALGAMVNRVKECIDNGFLHNLNVDLRQDKPEILAINDGNDSVKTSGFTYKTNAISLMRENEELKRLAIANDGKYVYIDTTHLKTYNKGGSHTIKH